MFMIRVKIREEIDGVKIREEIDGVVERTIYLFTAAGAVEW